MPKVSKIATLEYLCNIEKEQGGVKLMFCLQINIKLIPLILLRIARPANSTQNNKFAKYLQYLMKEVRDEVDFLCNEHYSFL